MNIDDRPTDDRPQGPFTHFGNFQMAIPLQHVTGPLYACTPTTHRPRAGNGQNPPGYNPPGQNPLDKIPSDRIPPGKEHR